MQHKVEPKPKTIRNYMKKSDLYNKMSFSTYNDVMVLVYKSEGIYIIHETLNLWKTNSGEADLIYHGDRVYPSTISWWLLRKDDMNDCYQLEKIDEVKDMDGPAFIFNTILSKKEASKKLDSMVGTQFCIKTHMNTTTNFGSTIQGVSTIKWTFEKQCLVPNEPEMLNYIISQFGEVKNYFSNDVPFENRFKEWFGVKKTIEDRKCLIQ